MTTATEPEVIEVPAGHVRFLLRGAELAKGASKNAVRLCSGLRLTTGTKEAEQLGTDAEGIMNLIHAREDEKLSVFLPLSLIPAAQVGVSLEIGSVTAARESNKKAMVEDLRPVDKTGNQLNALLKNLGGEPLFQLDE